MRENCQRSRTTGRRIGATWGHAAYNGIKVPAARLGTADATPRQRRQFYRRSEGGFLLLEVLVAVFLLAVSLFVLIEQLSVCVAEARSIQNYAVSDMLLANKSYEFRTERASDILDQDGKFDRDPYNYPDYSWTRKFEGTDTEGLWQQTITVYWHEHGKEVSDSIVEYRYLPDKTR